MKNFNEPSTSRNTPIIRIIKRAKNKKFGRKFSPNKKDIVFLPMDGYSHEVTVRDQNYSNSDDEYVNLEKALYSSNANFTNPKSLGPNIPKNRAANDKIKRVQAKAADEAAVSEPPNVLLDSWDAYLRVEHPELFDEDFKLPDTTKD